MTPNKFDRVSLPESVILHVGKERFPHEALCGKILCETRVNGRGRRKCENCQKSLAATNRGQK